MSAVLFLLRRTMKNELLSFFRKRSRFLPYLLLVAVLLFSAFATALDPDADEGLFTLDPRALHLGYVAVQGFFFGISMFSCLQRNAVLFRRSDVGLLFVSPVPPRAALAYGMLRQAGNGLAALVLLLLYAPTYGRMLSLPTAHAAGLLAGVGLMLLVSQFFAMFCLSLAAGNPRRLQLLRAAAGACLAYAVVVAGGLYLRSGGGWEGFLAAAGSPLLDAAPVYGWISGAILQGFAGNWAAAAGYAGLTLLCIAAATFVFFRRNIFFYEDVLDGAERAEELLAARRSNGNLNLNLPSSRKLRVRGEGLGHGRGASAFFFKHLREARRQSLFWPLDAAFLLVFAVSFLTVLLLRRETPDPFLLMVVGYVESLYMNLFLTFTGDWQREAQRPYWRLVPEAPLRKAFWTCAHTAVKMALQGVVLFAVIAWAASASPGLAACAALAYAGAALFFTSCSALVHRILGESKRGILVGLFIVAELLLLLPGIALAILGYFLGGSFLPPLAPLFAALAIFLWDALVSVPLLLLASRC